MRYKWLFLGLIGGLIIGCSSATEETTPVKSSTTKENKQVETKETTSTEPKVDKKSEQAQANVEPEKSDQPELLESKDDNYFVYKHHDRIYVIGQKKMSDKFQKYGHLPYTRTILGAGPDGETVVFQVDNKDPKLAYDLEKAFKGK